MRKTLLLLPFLVAVLSLRAPLASAQETGSGTATGSGIVRSFSFEELQRQEIARQWEARLARSENFRQQWLQEKTFVKAMQANDNEYRKRRDGRREDCRADIRKSSKLSQFTVSLECYREELADNLERLAKQKEYLERVPGVSDDVRWLAITRIDLLGDALNVIVNAIDSDVYQTVEELAEAKQNLLISYRQPLWLMETRVRADKLLTWTASLLTRIGTMGQTEIDAATSESLFNGVACISESETMLKEVVASQDISIASAKLTLAQQHLRGCVAAIRGESTYAAASESEEEEESAEVEASRVPVKQEMTSRRVQRRLTRQSEFRFTRTSQGNHAAAGEAKPFDTRLALSGDNDNAAATTCDGQPVSRRLQRRIGDTCNIAR